MAKDYIASGAEVVILTATRLPLLEQAKKELEVYHKDLVVKKNTTAAPTLNVQIHSIDVSDETAMRALVLACDDEFQLDCVVANAGIDADRMLAQGLHQTEIYRRVTQVNVNGVLNTVEPIVDRFKQRSMSPKGQSNEPKLVNGQIAPRCPTQIVIVSSIAGQFPLLHGAYSASKAWSTMYARCLRADLTKHNVSVIACCPGFVKTPLLDNISEKTDELLFVVNVEDLSQEIISATQKDMGHFIFSRKCYLIAQAERLIGCNFYDFALRHVQFMPEPKAKAKTQ